MDENADTTVVEVSEQILEDLANVASGVNERPDLREADLIAAGGGKERLLAKSGERVDPSEKLVENRVKGQEVARRLRDEPFVSRILVEEEGVKKIFYFCRGAPPSQNGARYGKLASYRTELGQLAEYEPSGEEDVEISVNGKLRVFRMLERDDLTPQRDGNAWDASDQRRLPAARKWTHWSLRGLIKARRPGTQIVQIDALFTELAEEAAAAAATAASEAGFRRQARTTLSLRDQAILDRFQGGVFRLPLGHRIMLSGPPGTGKTTTLIKRLAQKLDPQFWGDDERERLGEREHLARSWVMFSPTDLLKLYLKEAFAKEQVPAAEAQVKTWDDERVRLARDVLGILKAARSGRFVLKKELSALLDERSSFVWKLFEAFQAEFEAEAIKRYEEAFDGALRKERSPAVREVVEQMRARAGAKSVEFDRLYDLVELQSALAGPVEDMARDVKQRCETLVTALHRKYPTLIEDLAVKIDDLLAPVGARGDDDDDDGEEATGDAGASAKKRTVDALTRAFRWLARETARGAAPKPSARYYKLVEFLGERRPAEADLLALGELQVLRTQVTFLSEGHKNLIERIPDAFQRFRRRAIQEEQFYKPDMRERIVRNEISPAEIDVVVLAMLRSSRHLLERTDRRWRSNTPLAILEAIEGEYRMQVLVDEATDFSSVQLASMLALSHPLFSSFFASGDLRQRMTTFGVRSLDELHTLSPDFELRHVSTGYRQSSRLTGLTQKLAALLPGPEDNVRPFYDDQPGDVPPLLREGVSGAQLTEWLAARILEIESALDTLPSIAIFVGGDEDIAPLVSALSPILEAHNVAVRECRGGRDVGNENEIRVFAAKYIKGLEFEAVFFVGVDRIHNAYADLFAQMLYVGVTRATRYLGITCEGALPESLEPLRGDLQDGSWG